MEVPKHAFFFFYLQRTRHANSRNKQQQHELISRGTTHWLCTQKSTCIEYIIKYIVPMSINISMLTARHDAATVRVWLGGWRKSTLPPGDCNMQRMVALPYTCTKSMGFRHAPFRCPQSAFLVFLHDNGLAAPLFVCRSPAWRGY